MSPMSPLWPRKPWTAGALVALALQQVVFGATEPSSFATDDPSDALETT
jgi:hypothetical protein